MPKPIKDPGSYEGLYGESPIDDGIQKQLNTEGEGWVATDYVLVVGCIRPTDNGWERRSFLYTAQGQADYVTDGLINKSSDLLAESQWAEEVAAEAAGDDEED